MKRFFAYILLLLIPAATLAADVSFKAAAPPAVVVGETFSLTYTVNAEVNQNDLRILGEFTGLDISYGPSVSYNRSIGFSSSGQAVSETSVKFTYVLVAKTEGTFAIPAASIKVGNSTYTSNTLNIKVLPQDQAAGAQASTASAAVNAGGVFILMNLSRKNVYEQEAVLATFKLYTKDPDVAFRSAKFPGFEGFLAQEIELPQNKLYTQETYNGSNYFAVVMKQTLLFPQRSGNLTIEAGKFEITVRVRTQQRIRSIFEDFFDTYQNVNKQIATNPATIEVRPLPSGKPASYAGAVGDFNLTASLAPQTLKANEAVTLKITISGTGNLRVIKNPEVHFPNDFEVYDPNIVDNNIRITAAGASGGKTIEYVAIPRYAGDFEIPAVLFSYFDTKTGAYKTLSAGPYNLHVEKSDGADNSAPVISNFGNRENVRNIGQDIRYLKVKGIRFINTKSIFTGSITFYLCYFAPALFAIILFFIYRKQVKENANLALVRNRKANKTAVRRLRNAGRLMRENKTEDFYDETLHAVWGYLSDKLNIPLSNLTKDNVETELNRYGANEALIQRFMDILSSCEFTRYAPTQEAGLTGKIYEEALNAIGEMENTLKK
ncbi:MAG: BatD family protein [Tannerellaceae bacterium]|jgi:hypothetical protein|nr:BatD family protein [Tannerellaceae bacterium]